MLETSMVLVGAAVLFGVLVLLTFYLQIANIIERKKDARKAEFFGSVDLGGQGGEDIPHPESAEEQQWVLELLLDRAGRSLDSDQWQEIRQVAANECGEMLRAKVGSRKPSDRLYALAAIYRLGLGGFGRTVAKLKPRNGLESMFRAAILDEVFEAAGTAGSIKELSLGRVYEAIQASEQKEMKGQIDS